MVAIETYWPSIHKAGLTFAHVVVAAAYAGPTWSLTTFVRGPSSFDLDGEAFDTSHRFTASASDTAEWLPGSYSWQIRATDGENVVEVGAGRFEVLPDIATAEGGYDPRTHAERVLAAIEALIEGKASSDQKLYEINGRRLERFSHNELLTLRNKYRAEVNRERRAKAGNLFSGAVKVRF